MVREKTIEKNGTLYRCGSFLHTGMKEPEELTKCGATGASTYAQEVSQTIQLHIGEYHLSFI